MQFDVIIRIRAARNRSFSSLRTEESFGNEQVLRLIVSFAYFLLKYQFYNFSELSNFSLFSQEMDDN